MNQKLIERLKGTFQRRGALVLSLIVGIIIGVVLISFFASRKDSPTDPFVEGLSVSNVIPQNNQKGVTLFPAITIVFSRALTESEKSITQASSRPQMSFSQSWNQENDQLSLRPLSVLTSNQNYTITLSGVSPVFSWTFTTAPIEKTSTEDQIKIQSQSDKEDADYWKNVNTQYPWYDSLPLQAQNYYVYFDLEKYTFVGKLYPQKASSAPVDAQVDVMKSEILQKLTQLGIDVKTAPIEWIIKEE